MKIAFLTSGGIAPCLSASIGHLIESYINTGKKCEMIGYLNGYRGLLEGKTISFNENVKLNYKVLFNFGGSPIGNSRVKLTNIKDCIKKGYIQRGENPLKKAALQLIKDKVDILHTIGGDDTNTTAADLVKYLKEKKYNLTVVGLPKTIDNDVIPIKQSLGAWTAAEQSANFFKNIVNENTTSSRNLIIHEVMGRNCGWLTAYSAYLYQKSLQETTFLPDILVSDNRWSIHAIYIPEIKINLDFEIIRLKKVMDKNDCVNIFLSEGAGISTIISEIESEGLEVKRDAFGHVRLDEINPGKWYSKKLGKSLKADKILIQKSGYFARSASPNEKDLELIKKSSELAVKNALKKNSGVIGNDEENKNKLSCIKFDRIKGHKEFNVDTEWFNLLLNEIGQK
ncbi:MAG: pyrophosphate--fructose-6-phosphate 1-phosphotransferase [Candidatus Marinimicrobia bacterium]|nr:pyrophosphate--fructose-6-phosphate 1-phosphotransferase [Candidatus Neomarinimicrobiota bacterium]